MINSLEESLNGGYEGLRWEVEEDDCYKLKKINFIPDIAYDFGCNIGVTSRYLRKLFPHAFIVSVEPHPENLEVFKQFTNDDNLVLIEKAIGLGKVWRAIGAANGTGENYMSDGLGYPENEMAEDERMVQTEIPTIMPDEIINQYLKEGMKSVLKMDIEAAENIIWAHDPSMQALRKIDYLAIEVHNFALNGGTWQEVQDKTAEALKSFELTHTCRQDGVHFFATKK